MVLESPVPGALIGKTIIFILGDQFARLKLGDRYFFDLQNQAGSFTIGIILTMVLTNLNVFKSLCNHYFCLKTWYMIFITTSFYYYRPAESDKKNFNGKAAL